MLAQLFAGIGSQHFYPEESTLGVWAAMFLTLRVYFEDKRVRDGVINIEGSWGEQSMQHQYGAIPAVGIHGITEQ